MSVSEFGMNMDKRCYKCKYLKIEKAPDWYSTGDWIVCKNPDTKVKKKQNKSIFDRACVHKEMDK